MLIIHTLYVGGDAVPSYDVYEETALAVAAVVAADVLSAADVLISEIASKNHQLVHTRRKESPGSLVKLPKRMEHERAVLRILTRPLSTIGGSIYLP